RVTVPLLAKPPPPNDPVVPPVILNPEMAADAPELMLNTRLALLPLTESRLAPGPLIVVVTASVRVSWPLVRVMVCVEVNRLEKTTVSAPALALALRMAWRSEPAPLSLVV